MLRPFLLFLAIMFAAQVTANDNVNIQKSIDNYFNTYAQRKDFDKFMNFYANNAQLKDIIYGNELVGKASIRAFFDWDRGQFHTQSGGPVLSIHSQVISGNNVVTRGVFEKFIFNGQTLGPWQFILWHTFNDQGKISYQEDWINYSPKKILIGE